MATVDWSALRASLMSQRNEATLPPHVKLPILPLAVTKFAQRAEDPQADPCELGRIIETDSGLTCELLRYVNSSAMGLRKKAAGAQHAISMLGVCESKLYLLHTAVKRAMRGTESKLISIQNFWSANLERALLAREVALLLKTDAELAFAAGVLQDFLLPLLTNELFPAYFRFTKTQDEQPVTLCSFERQEFRWDHADVAAQIMQRWGFPDDLVCCVLLHHRGLKLLNDKHLGRTAVAAVAVSALMPGPLRQVPDGLERLIKLSEVWPAFDLQQVAQKVDEKYRTLSPGPANPFSLLRLVRRAEMACA